MRNLIVPVALVTIFLASCSRKDDVVKPEGKTIVRELVASFRGNDTTTRTSILVGGKVGWAVGDTIRYFSSDNGTVHEFVNPSKGLSVTIPAEVAENDEWIIAAYGGKISGEHTKSYFELEDVVKAEQSGKFQDAHVSVAGTRFESGNKLTFWNMTSLIQFSFNREDVAYVIFKANEYYKLHGDGKLDIMIDYPDTAVVSFPEGTVGGTEIKVNVGGSGTYYISTLPGKLSQGFTIELYNEAGYSLGYAKSDKPLILKSSGIVNLGTLDNHIKTKPIESVKLDVDTLHLMAGTIYNSYKLNATVEPSGVTVSGFEWKSKHDSVYVLPQGDGTVYALGKCTTDVVLYVHGYGVETPPNDTTVKDSCHVIVHDFSDATDLGKDSPSNCYLISTTSQKLYKFCCGCKGNDPDKKFVPASVEVIWESFGTKEDIEEGDLIYIVKLKEDSVAFVSTGRKGNALIAAKDNKGDILWSWHIWITDFNHDEYHLKAGAGEGNNVRVMDRNLGATSATPDDPCTIGLLYQWGRKDPFLNCSAFSAGGIAKSTLNPWPSTVKAKDHLGSDNSTLDYSISHPTTFIDGDRDYFSWFCVEEQYWGDVAKHLWNDSNGKKGLYDPCPVGYRVPKDSLWMSAFGVENNFYHPRFGYYGMNFGSGGGEPYLGGKQMIWYPACGSKYGSGIGAVGNNGYWWSCIPIDWRHSYALEINLYTVSDFNVLIRAQEVPCMGYSVRCIKE